MIEYKTHDFSISELRQAAQIQIQELPEGFLSSLGEKPLALIFRHVAESQFGLMVLAVDNETNCVVGYVFGAIHTGKLYKDFLMKRTLVALRYFLPKLLSWTRIKKAFETLLYPAKKGTVQNSFPKSELLDLAVTHTYHGTGVAQYLFTAFVDLCKSKGIRSFVIPTTEGLDRAHRFYEKMGAKRVGVVEVHDGQNTYIYQYDIQEEL